MLYVKSIIIKNSDLILPPVKSCNNAIWSSSSSDKVIVMNHVRKIANSPSTLYFISFKFMKIIIIHAFTVSYESFASFFNAAVNWHAFNSLMIIKSSRPKKGWTQFAKKNLVKKSVQVAIVHHSFSWSSSNKVQVLYVRPYSIQWSNK